MQQPSLSLCLCNSLNKAVAKYDHCGEKRITRCRSPAKLLTCEVVLIYLQPLTSGINLTLVFIHQKIRTVVFPLLLAVYTPTANLICGAMKLHTKSVA